MNYITPHGICVLYPSITFAHVGLLNPAWLDDDGSSTAYIQSLIDKYVARGSKFYHSYGELPEHADGNPTVDVSFLPTTNRFTDDTCCLTVLFDSNQSWDSRIDVPVSTSMNHAVWQLGGWYDGSFSHGKAIVTTAGANGAPAIVERWTYQAGHKKTKVLYGV